MAISNIKVGDKFNTNEGDVATVVKYTTCHDIDVRFSDSTVATVKASELKKGKIKNRNFKSVQGVGCLGTGIHTATIGSVRTPQYGSWSRMLERCYSDNYDTYEGCTVVSEWHNFQNYANWYNDRVRCIDTATIKICLDKDLLSDSVRGKLYSPEFCVFLPQEINHALIQINKKDNDLPVGVRSNKSGRYHAGIRKYDKPVFLGSYASPQEASDVYQNALGIYLSELAYKFRDSLEQRAFDKLITWKPKKL